MDNWLKKVYKWLITPHAIRFKILDDNLNELGKDYCEFTISGARTKPQHRKIQTLGGSKAITYPQDWMEYVSKNDEVDISLVRLKDSDERMILVTTPKRE